MQKSRCGKLKQFILTGLFAGLGLFCSAAANAASSDTDSSQLRLDEILKTAGKGWQLKSNGGLLYIHPEDKRFWVSLSGVLRFDQTYFSGNAYDKSPIAPGKSGFPSGGNLRKAEVDLTGGIGPDWNYTLGLEFGDTGTKFAFADSWLSYSGFCDNIEVFVGRHSANWFGLENSTSSSWYPFLERSLQASVFYPGDGLGVLVDAWWSDGGLTAIALQPDHGPRLTNRGRFISNDRWMALACATFAPVHESGDVWHLGTSLLYRDDNPSIDDADFTVLTTFASRPAARARNTDSIVDTGRLRIKNITQVSVEAARQCGPLLVQAEYSQAHIKRRATTLTGTRPSLSFDGWSVIGQYMLTGEVQNYDVRDGTFTGFDVSSPYGAFEVAARYDFLNLNNKDIHGGSGHDVTLGLNWYANNNVRVAFNYVNANIWPTTATATTGTNPAKRRLNIFAVRLQVKFK